MKKIALVLGLFLIPLAMYSQEGSAPTPAPAPSAAPSQSAPPPIAPSYYTQLIGFKFGGELFFNTMISGWSSTVFFENVINNWLGLEIEMTKSSIPVKSYTSPSGTATTGNGERSYIEMSGGIKLYLQSISFPIGLSYNAFTSGYIVDSTASTYTQMSDKEINFFSAFTGVELTSQISTDLFAKVGFKVIYGIINDSPNYTFGGRFYISFAYGM